MTGWEKEWPKPKIEWPTEAMNALVERDEPVWPKSAAQVLQHDTTITPELTGVKPDWLENIPDIKFTKQGSNLVDAEAYLYFQCESCDTILDPHTRSFARLQQARVDKGWQCVWNTNGLGYNVYCEKCGEK